MSLVKQLMQKNILLNVLILFLLVAIYLASSWGLAYVSAIQPHQLMLQWASNKRPFSEKQWHVAIDKMQAIVNDNPNNAQHIYDLARLYDLSAYQKPIWSDEAIKHRSQAITLYKQALERRPTWSGVWADLAMSKTLNLEFGDDAKQALSNALTFGAWEQGVFHKVLWVSVANWNALPGELQLQIENKIKETVNSKGQVPRYIQQTATHFNWQDTLKNMVDAKINE